MVEKVDSVCKLHIMYNKKWVLLITTVYKHVKSINGH